MFTPLAACVLMNTAH